MDDAASAAGPFEANGHGSSGIRPPPPPGGDPDAPGCWQLPGLLLRLVFWLGMLLVVLWLLVVLLSSVW